MIEILIRGIFNCITVVDKTQFGMCIDNVVLEYNQSIDDEVSEMAIATN